MRITEHSQIHLQKIHEITLKKKVFCGILALTDNRIRRVISSNLLYTSNKKKEKLVSKKEYIHIIIL